MATRFAACTSFSAASRTFEVTWSAGVPTIVERAAAQTPAPCGTQGGTMQ
jgi:hypothetical protein